jgi:hypothetical protein
MMPESLSVEPDLVEGDDYPISVVLRSSPKPNPKSRIPGDEIAANIPNGIHRNNLRADVTDTLLRDAQNTQGTSTEKVLAKYVVGCDGAHSWTRRQIGCVMEGDHTDFVWSVYLWLSGHRVSLLTGRPGGFSISFPSLIFVSLKLANAI